MDTARNQATYREEAELIKPICGRVARFQNVAGSTELKQDCLKYESRAVHSDVFFENSVY